MQSDNALPALKQFPDLESRLHSLRIYADYKWRKDTTVKLSYQYEKYERYERYERYDEDDWTIDGLGPSSFPEVLLLGEQNPSYSQHVVGVSLAIRF